MILRSEPSGWNEMRTRRIFVADPPHSDLVYLKSLLGNLDLYYLAKIDLVRCLRTSSTAGLGSLVASRLSQILIEKWYDFSMKYEELKSWDVNQQWLISGILSFTPMYLLLVNSVCTYASKCHVYLNRVIHYRDTVFPIPMIYSKQPFNLK